MKKPKAKLEQLQQQLKIQPIKDRRMRIMWNSNGVHTNSGYAVEQRDILWRLIADGWIVSQIAFSGHEGAPVYNRDAPFDKYPLLVYPKMADTWGSDAIMNHSAHWRANVVFSMQDVGWINAQALDQVNKNKIAWIPYVPIDMEPASEPVINNLRFAYKIVTFSNFGKKTIQKKGFSSTMIYEGTDCTIFQPRDQKEARLKLGWPQDKYIFGMIGANKENPPRKGWQEGLEAFKKFSDVHPEALLYYHINQWAPGGFPILQFAQHLGIKDKIFQLDQYLTTFHANSAFISQVMNALDCLLQPSMTEGFGLPIIEAQASGTPVIVNDCTSMPELIIDGVTSEKCDTVYDKYKQGRIYSNQLGYIYFADVDSLYEKMEKVYKNGKGFYTQAAREWVFNNFNIDTLVKDSWIPFLEELQQELLGPLPPTLQNIGQGVQLEQLNKTL